MHFFSGLFLFLIVVNFLCSPLASLETLYIGDLALQNLEKQVSEDLKKLNIPPKSWTRPLTLVGETPTLDVAIIGGGMAGNAAAFALIKEGIVNIKIFDANPEDKEGSWNTYARMKQLRTSKTLSGPAIGSPSLTFCSWYGAIHGSEAWQSLGFIPTATWCDYLQWYRKVLKLPICNEMILKSITPKELWLELAFDTENGVITYLARKVVLATGMEGFGGGVIPSYMAAVPKDCYATAYESIDFENLKEKRVAVIGAGASAFDATALALECGATSVDMFVRRDKIPSGKSFSQFTCSGVQRGFYWLPDELRWRFFAKAFGSGIAPPKAALDRVAGYENFFVHLDSELTEISLRSQEIVVHTNHASYTVDFIILATGFAVNGELRPELKEHMPSILLWKDKIFGANSQESSKVESFPYLGPHFQFLESHPGTAPHLQHMYCFNYGAFVSHGPLTCDINGISIGADRLAHGIAIDFLLEDAGAYFPLTTGATLAN